MNSLKRKILLVLAGASATIGMNSGERQVETMVSRDLELLTVGEQLSKNVSQRVAIVRGYALFGDGSFSAGFSKIYGNEQDAAK